MRRIAVPFGLTPQSARPREGRPIALEGPTMGVVWRLQARVPSGVSDAAVARAVQDACDLVVAQMSTWEPDSDLSRFNRAAAGSWVSVPHDLMTVVKAALDLADQSGGAFDPTVGPLVDLWGFGPPGGVAAAPDPGGLEAAQTGWRRLAIDEAAGRLFQSGGVEFDLCGIAKGYGVDLAAGALEALGVRDYLLEIGGELRGSGVKGDGEPWWVEIEPPPDARLAEPPPLIALHGLSIATSGDWRRAFVADGRRYSHTIDPRTRAPVEPMLAAVSVLHPDCMHADALCTALMVLGPAAEAFARDHDLAALFVVRQGGGYDERRSPAFERLLG